MSYHAAPMYTWRYTVCLYFQCISSGHVPGNAHIIYAYYTHQLSWHIVYNNGIHYAHTIALCIVCPGVDSNCSLTLHSWLFVSMPAVVFKVLCDLQHVHWDREREHLLRARASLRGTMVEPPRPALWTVVKAEVLLNHPMHGMSFKQCPTPSAMLAWPGVWVSHIMHA